MLRKTETIIVAGMICMFCVPVVAQQSRRDAGGVIMKFSEFQSISPAEVVINIGDLEKFLVDTAKQQIRDKIIVHQRVRLNKNKLYLSIQHNLEGSYNLGTTKKYNDKSEFDKMISKYHKRRSISYETLNTTRIYLYDNYGGYITHVKRSSGSQCLFARVGYSTNPPSWTQGDEKYQTLLYVRDCSQRMTLDELSRFLSKVKIVEPAYNENAFARSRAVKEGPKLATSSDKPTLLDTLDEKRPFAVQWEGIDKLIAGTLTLQPGKGGGKLSMTLPENQGTCGGAYRIGAEKKGTWSVACTNGMAASGNFAAFGKGKGSAGDGIDSLGRKVRFTVGGR